MKYHSICNTRLIGKSTADVILLIYMLNDYYYAFVMFSYIFAVLSEIWIYFKNIIFMWSIFICLFLVFPIFIIFSKYIHIFYTFPFFHLLNLMNFFLLTGSHAGNYHKLSKLCIHDHDFPVYNLDHYFLHSKLVEVLNFSKVKLLFKFVWRKY